MATRIGPGKRLVVIGGGISGLSYLHYLRNFIAFTGKIGYISKITLLESNDYMGGSVKTHVHDDGVVHELGPRTIRYAGVKGNNTASLIEQIGLADKVVTVKKQSEVGKTRYVYRNGSLHKVPGSIMDVFKRLPGEKTRAFSAIKREFTQKKMDLSSYEHGDPPLYEFIKYRMGEAVAESLMDPLLRGIVAGDVRKLSTRSYFEEVLEKEQQYGSWIKSFGKPPVIKMQHDELYPSEIMESKLLDTFRKDKVTSYTIDTGLQTLPEHLSNSLLNTNEDGLISIYNRTRVDSIDFNSEDPDKAPCSVRVKTVDGDTIEIDADHIVSTIGARDLTGLLPKDMPSDHNDAFSFLKTIEHVPVACVGLEYRNLGRLPAVTKSFGFLTHSKAGCKVLGISFDTMFNPAMDKPNDAFRMTCMMGGAWFADVFGNIDPSKVTNAQMEQIALTEVEKTLGIKAEPYRTCFYMWTKGIAQYRPGHKDNLSTTRGAIKRLGLPLTLLGQSCDGVSVNDVIWSARAAANELVDSL